MGQSFRIALKFCEGMREESIAKIKGIGTKTEALFEKLGIFTIDELLKHYPYRYMEFEAPTTIKEAIKNEGEKITVEAKPIKAFLNRFSGRYKITSTVLSDPETNIECIWYNSPFVSHTIKLYKTYIFSGYITNKRGHYVLEHPVIYTKEEYEKLIGSLKPVYSLTKGLSNKLMTKSVEGAFLLVSAEDYYEYLPKKILEKYSLRGQSEAIEGLHFPKDYKELEAARKRAVFDEFFQFIYYTKLVKKNSVNIASKYPVSFDKEESNSLCGILPFELTDSQNKVIGEIIRDMSSGNVMNRLIQGDVGCGKTVIGIFAMYACFVNGYQSAIMAPTEVLANQHYKSLTKLFEKMENPPRIAMLTGSMTKKRHDEVHEAILKHEVDIVVGTHAIISEKVKFNKLALVITDEQHRFGVRQRQSFADKGEYPHIMVMSATPIPRTLAVILYGDMDVSVVETKPQGRIPIKNAVIKKEDRKKAYKHILGELEKGHQAYIICAMVEESENIEAENVVEYTEILKENFPEKYKIQYLHGKLPQSAKDDIMRDFADKKIDILVSTTVIEVGIDVKNATVMLIEDAQRFGLASLHQLRGRVGRSDIQSYCIFVLTSNKENAKKRMDIIGSSNDGFYIANEDMKLRGPGELFGMAQSGDFGFGLADIYNDSNTLKLAAKAVEEVLNTELEENEKELLNRKIEEYSYKSYKKMTL